MAKGLYVVAWETHETIGLGEAGSTIKPEMRWALRRDGDVIFDIGYGVEGAKTLNLIEGAKDSDLKIYAVVNVSRPMTSTESDIIEYIRELGPVTGIINNTHLGDETTLEVIQEGARIISKAAKILGLPVTATTVDEKFTLAMGQADVMGNPVRILNRIMPKTFW